jgi:hypothetical protein
MREGKRGDLQRVERDNGEVVRNGFNVEPTALVERVLLHFGDEVAPDIEVTACPEVWPSLEDVVGQDIIVAKGGNDGNDKVIGRVVVRLLLILAENFTSSWLSCVTCCTFLGIFSSLSWRAESPVQMTKSIESLSSSRIQSKVALMSEMGESQSDVSAP